MREIRSSGSVEGVMGNRDSYSDSDSQAGANIQGEAIGHKPVTSIG